MEPLVLKEYDKIIRDQTLEKKRQYADNGDGTFFLCSDYFDELKNVLLKRESQESNYEELRGGVVRFLKLSNHKQHGEILQIQHYVGVIELSSGLQIEVLPKIELGRVDKKAENAGLENILIRMLGYLKDFPAIPSDTADLDTRKMSLYEVFIELYLEKVERLIRHGLKYTYVSVEESLPSFKGRLNVMSQLRFNSAKKQYFYVSHDERLLDTPENRLIKSSLLYLADKAGNNANSRFAKRLLETFEMVPESKDYLSDYAKISYDRFNDFYHDVIEWAIAFLLGKSFVISQGNTIADSLLFPMEKIFEAFIGRKLSRCLRDHQDEFQGWHIKTQSTKKYLFDDPKKFEIKPDIRVYRGSDDNETDIILDTKWKKLDSNRVSGNYGISTADMYQMYSYAKRYRANHVWLIYPYSKGEDEIDSKEYKTIYDPKEIKLDTNVTIHLKFIDLSALADSKCSSGMKAVEGQLKDLLKFSIETQTRNNQC